MRQGFSGSSVWREGDFVLKESSDEEFLHNAARQRDLAALSRRLSILPRIEHIEGGRITMEYIAGREGLTLRNARRAGQALRLLHAEQGYPHECMTGVEWLIALANENLAEWGLGRCIEPALAADFPPDALIHSEPAQVIERKNGEIVFIDFEGIGLGSRYQDLGFVYYLMMKDGREGVYAALEEGYRAGGGEVDGRRVMRLAGVIALAYARFAEREKRLGLGFRLLDKAGGVI